MDKEFEKQSNCLTNDNIKSQPNEEEDTEDIECVEDKCMSGKEVVNTEEEKLVTKPVYTIQKVVKVPTDSSQTEKRKSSPMILMFDPKNKQFKRADVVSIDSVETSDQNSEKQAEEPVEAVTASSQPKSFDKTSGETCNQSGNQQPEHTQQQQQEPPTVVTTAPQTLGPLFKCVFFGCSALCLEQSALQRHMEVDHKIFTCIEPSTSMAPLGTGSVKFVSKKAVRCSKAKNKSVTDDIKPDPDYVKNSEKLLDKSTFGKGTVLEKQTKEVLLNLMQFYKHIYPHKRQKELVEIVEMATKISSSSIFRVVDEYKRFGTLREVTKARKRSRKKPFKFVCNDEDRDIVSTVIYKLRDESKLSGYKSVYNEIRTSQEFNPTFKGCSLPTFVKLFKRFGFRIGDNRIIDIKPSDSEREQTACQRSKDTKNAKYVCDWPGCDKQFNCSQHVIIHLRTHTNVKPYVCRFPKCVYRCATGSNFVKHLKNHNKTIFANDDNDEEEFI